MDSSRNHIEIFIQLVFTDILPLSVRIIIIVNSYLVVSPKTKPV